MSVRLSKMVGNAALCGRIAQDITNNTLSHAYIIEGPEGSGRHTLAKSIAAALSCKSTSSVPCCSCNSCQKIFGDRNYVEMYDDLFEALAPHFEKMKLNTEGITARIKAKYSKKDDGVLR